MTLIKQYYIDNTTGAASSTATKNLRIENVRGSNILYHLEDANGYPFILADCQDAFISSTRIRAENLQEFENTPGVGIITYVGIEQSPWNRRKDPDAPTVLFYDVEYTEDNDLSQYGSIEIIDQDTFNQITADYDNRQHSRRVALLNDIKSAILTRINNFVSYLISEGVIAAPSELTTEAKNWRNQIINLGDSGFPRRLPLPPAETHGNAAFPAADYPQYQIRKDRVIRRIYRRWFDMYQYRKINADDIDSFIDVYTESTEYYEEE